MRPAADAVRPRCETKRAVKTQSKGRQALRFRRSFRFAARPTASAAGRTIVVFSVSLWLIDVDAIAAWRFFAFFADSAFNVRR